MAKQKKVKITLKIDRPNLAEDFSSWLKSRPTVSYGCYDDMYDGYWWDYDGWDSMTDDLMSRDSTPWWATDDDDELRYEDYWNSRARKKSNKRGKRNRKRSKQSDFDEESDNVISEQRLDEILSERKEIYFYEDIEDPDNVKKFNNLKKFYLFLDEQGIDISDFEGSKFIRETVRHCCIDPLKKDTLHSLEIISDHSYGALSYEVSEEASLFSD